MDCLNELYKLMERFFQILNSFLKYFGQKPTNTNIYRMFWLLLDLHALLVLSAEQKMNTIWLGCSKFYPSIL